MALVQCPECSNEVSDKAVACPRCGYPLKAAPEGKGSIANAEIKGLLAQGNKIAAIKHYRELHPEAGLAEAKQAVEELERGDTTTATDDVSARPSPTQNPSNGLSSGALVALVVVLVIMLVVLWRMVFSHGK